MNKNKNIEPNKEEPKILLERYSTTTILTDKICESFIRSKRYSLQETDGKVIYVFLFMKSPEFGDDRWRLNVVYNKSMLHFRNDSIEFRSYYDCGVNKRLCTTSEIMLLVNDDENFGPRIRENFNRITDSEIQIELLKNAGFKEFTLQLNDHPRKDDRAWWVTYDKLKIVDETSKFVGYAGQFCDMFDLEFYRRLNKNSNCLSNCLSEFILPAHMSLVCCPTASNLRQNARSIIILGKSAKMKHRICDGSSPFNNFENRDSLTFYCKPGSEVAVEILSKCVDKEEHYPEFYNATVVFMSPELVDEYQKNLDDVDNYQKMNEFIKRYEENKDYFSFKLSKWSNQRIEQLSYAQTNCSDTWEKFVWFMEEIGVKEKSDAEQSDEKKDNENEIGKLDSGTQENSEVDQSPEIKPIDESEENLSSFMQYLKDHWPRIFKFLNAICNFFSRSKNKSKDDDKDSLGNIINKQNQTQSLIDKTSALSSRENVPKNTENKSGITQENSIE